MKKSIAFLLLLTMLCTLSLHPIPLPQLLLSMQEIRVHKNWRESATQKNDVHIFEDGLYYSETDPKNIMNLSDHAAYVNNEIIVFFKDAVSVREKQSLFDSLNASVIGCADILNKYQLLLPDEKNFVELQILCTKLKTNRLIQFVCCNMALHLTEDVVPDDPWLHDDGTSAAPNWDESYVYGGNWWLNVTNTPSAWDHADVFHPICVGIVDSGFDTNHEDLQGKITFPSKFYEKRNIPDSHGTHVAGIISANANNKIGITGICDKANLLCVDWEPDRSAHQFWSTDERIITGIIALIKNGAKVINMSLGSSGGYEKSKTFMWNISMFFEGMMYSFIVASLLARGYDFLIVQSAGNGSSADEPCNSYYNGSFASITKRNAFTGLTGITKQQVLDHVIVVGSSTYAHSGTEFYQSSFSNYGDGVSIFAPGSFIYSTDIESRGKYSYKSGTSMAAPVVTGITALTWSVNPALKGAEVKRIVCDPANTRYTCKNYYWDEEIDIPTYPMINANLSVESAIKTLGIPTPPAEPPIEENSTEVSETETVTWIVPHPTIPFVRGNSENPIVERFRGEVGE